MSSILLCIIEKEHLLKMECPFKSLASIFVCQAGLTDAIYMGEEKKEGAHRQDVRISTSDLGH